MELIPEALTEQGYLLLDRLDHKELVKFTGIYLKKATTYTILYTVLNFVFFTLLALAVPLLIKKYDQGVGWIFAHIAYGVILAFLLIPLHEGIHALAYKLVGAKHTSFDYNIRKFYFLALADRFVASKSEFSIVALAPFVVITVACCTAIIFTGLLWKVTALATVFVHTIFCSGDFGLLSYFSFHKDKEIVTYDDKVKGISFFYGRSRS